MPKNASEMLPLQSQTQNNVKNEFRKSNWVQKVFKNIFKIIFKKMSFFDCRPQAGLRLVLPQICHPALGRPKAGLHFGKSGFENSKNAFFQKIKMVYAKSALTMLFGMLFLLQLCIGYLEKAFLAFKTKIQILRHPALGRPKAGWR